MSTFADSVGVIFNISILHQYFSKNETRLDAYIEDQFYDYPEILIDVLKNSNYTHTEKTFEKAFI